MTTPSRIHKLVLDFSFSKNQVNQSELYQLTKHLYDSELAYTLNDALEQHSDNQKFIIDKLVIDLGSINRNELKARFASELQLQLNTFRLQPRHTSDDNPSPENLLRAVLQFLFTGTFPWYANSDSIDINKEWLRAIENNHEELRDFLFTQMLNNIYVRNRVLYQLDRESILKTIAYLLPEPDSMNPAFFLDWSSVYSGTGNDDTTYTAESIRFLLSQKETKLTSVLIRNFIREVVFNNNIPRQLDIKTLADKVIRLYTEPKKVNSGVLRQKALQQLFKTVANESQIPFKQTSVAEDTISDFTETISGENSWHGVNCGLVLLHPFLSRFFMELELVRSDGTYISARHQMQACQILHYLASCENKTPEHLLTVPKLLCGIPLHYPIPKTLRLKPAHKQMCLELLDAVAEHWTALRGTSGEGLRRTFIQRDGLVKFESGVWTIFVERKTEDILLEQLPWSFSSFQNSWNNELIYVDWA